MESPSIDLTVIQSQVVTPSVSFRHLTISRYHAQAIFGGRAFPTCRFATVFCVATN